MVACLVLLLSATPTAVEVGFNGFFPAKLGSPLLDLALETGTFTHENVDGNHLFRTKAGEHTFQIKYDRKRAEWVLSALILSSGEGGTREHPLLRAPAPATERYSPASVEVQWRMHGSDAVLEDLTCDYSSESSRLEATQLKEELMRADSEAERSAAREAEMAAAAAMAHAETTRAASSQYARRVNRNLNAGTSQSPSDNTIAIVAAMAAFCALVILLVGVCKYRSPNSATSSPPVLLSCRVCGSLLVDRLHHVARAPSVRS